MDGIFQNGNYQIESNSNDMTGLDIQTEETLLDHMEISIVEAEKRANGGLNLREFYTVYLIDAKVIDPEFKDALTTVSSLWRRYTEFEMLRAYLEISYPYIVLPPLPEKKVLYAWQKITTDTFDPDFVDRRRAGLENFLLRIASHPVLSRDKHFMGFLQQKDGWRESIKESGRRQFKRVCKSEVLPTYNPLMSMGPFVLSTNSCETGYLQIAESKLKALSVAVRLRKPDKHFETIKNYGIALQNNLCNLLRARARLVEKQYTLYKLHANYGRVFSEWSAIEKELGDGLQKSGHYMDSLAATIDTTLEEEELIADQLKEWLFGASALQAVVRRREALQLAKEEANDNLNAAYEQKDKVMQGKSGIMSLLFGSVDTEEVREFKIIQLEQRIRQNEEAVKQVDDDLKLFSAKATMDIERFQHQKVIDLKETLAAYCVLQFKLARKGLQSWQHIKQCLEAMP